MAVQVKHVTVHRNGQWWVVNTSPPSGKPTIYTVAEGTQDDAAHLPDAGGISGPYSSLAAADAVAAKEPENSTQGTGIPGLSVTPGGGFQASNPLTGLAAIGDFFQRLTQGSTWIRVGEVVLGLILLAAGLARITHAIPAATRVARAVGTKGLA